MNKLKWKKSQVFDVVYWFSGHNEHTTRYTFNIDKTSEEYPYRLSMAGSYLGDFRTLKSAKDHAEMELRTAIDSQNAMREF